MLDSAILASVRPSSAILFAISISASCCWPTSTMAERFRPTLARVRSVFVRIRPTFGDPDRICPDVGQLSGPHRPNLAIPAESDPNYPNIGPDWTKCGRVLPGLAKLRLESRTEPATRLLNLGGPEVNAVAMLRGWLDRVGRLPFSRCCGLGGLGIVSPGSTPTPFGLYPLKNAQDLLRHRSCTAPSKELGAPDTPDPGMSSSARIGAVETEPRQHPCLRARKVSGGCSSYLLPSVLWRPAQATPESCGRVARHMSRRDAPGFAGGSFPRRMTSPQPSAPRQTPTRSACRVARSRRVAAPGPSRRRACSIGRGPQARPGERRSAG